jgi:hypothetical protein
VKEMVIEFGTSRNKLLDSKLHRYRELNSKYFMQQEMSDIEVVEWNKLEQWLKIHSN